MPKFLYNLDLDFGQLKKARVEILDTDTESPEAGQEGKWVGRLAYNNKPGHIGLYIYTENHEWNKLLDDSNGEVLTLVSLKEKLNDNSLNADLKKAIEDITEPDTEARTKEGATGNETRQVFAKASDLDTLRTLVNGINNVLTTKTDFTALKNTVDTFLVENTDASLDTIKEIVDLVKANKEALATLENAHQAAQNQILLYSKDVNTQAVGEEVKAEIALDDATTPINNFTVQLYDTDGNMVFAGVKKEVGKFIVSTAEPVQLVAVITAKKSAPTQ